MSNNANPIGRRFQLAGLLLILGLLTEVVCLFWARPLSFLVLVGVGGAFLLLGVAVYLLSLLPARHPSEDNSLRELDKQSEAVHR
jgi:hypothetical protein